MIKLYLFFFTCFTIFSISEGLSQTIGGSGKFVINGEIIGRDTGTVILWYSDKNNKGEVDTALLKKGKFHFSGTNNRICQAILWADPSNHLFDNPSMLRFLLEPGELSIICKKNIESKGIVKGSQAQLEKTKWDQQNAVLLSAKASVFDSIFSLVRLSNADKDPELQEQIGRLAAQRDKILEQIKILDVKYIEQHPASYLSAYLLFQHERKLSVDSVQRYYQLLSKEAKKSTIGHAVLSYIYPLTDDNEFRKANPLVDLQFNERLSEIKSVYDLSESDTSGKTVTLSSFKGKYLVIDFWASWCKPCIANVPMLNYMENYYNPDSVKFISISLDEDASKWKRSILNNNFTGIQLSDLKGFYSLAAQYFKVLWVPKYIIADRNGHIINYDAPQAVDPELKILIDKLLKQGPGKSNSR